MEVRRNLQKRFENIGWIIENESVENKEDEFIIKLRDLILEHMVDEDFGVPALCQLIFMSRTQLHNKIKSLTNKSTSQFIRSVRIERSCQLLESSELNISEIALEVGIDSLSYFSRIFRQEKGFSPQQYRERE